MNTPTTPRTVRPVKIRLRSWLAAGLRSAAPASVHLEPAARPRRDGAGVSGRNSRINWLTPFLVAGLVLAGAVAESFGHGYWSQQVRYNKKGTIGSFEGAGSGGQGDYAVADTFQFNRAGINAWSANSMWWNNTFFIYRIHGQDRNPSEASSQLIRTGGSGNDHYFGWDDNINVNILNGITYRGTYTANYRYQYRDNNGTYDTVSYNPTFFVTNGHYIVTNLTGTIAQTAFNGGETTLQGTGRNLIKWGASTLTLSGNNTFTGHTYIDEGTVSISHNSGAGTGGTIHLGPESGALNANLYLTGGRTVTRPVIVRSGGSGTLTLGSTDTGSDNTYSGTLALNKAATLTAGSGRTVTFSGVVSGAGNPTKTGAGRVTLSNTANTFSGTLTLNQGILRTSANNNSALGTSSILINGAGTTLELDANNNRAYARPTTISANTTIKPGRTSNGAATSHTLGTLSIGANTLAVETGGFVTSGTAGLTFGNTAFSGTPPVFNVAANTLLTLGALQSAGNFTKQGAGQLTLGSAAAAGRNSGALTITAGKVRLGNNTSPLGTAACTITMSGGELELGRTGNDLNLYPVTISGNATIIPDRGGASTVNHTTRLGTLSIGAHTLTLVKGGFVTSPGISTLQLGAATFTGAPTFDVPTEVELLFSSTINNGGHLMTVQGTGNTTASGIISGSGGLTKSGAGTMTVSAANTYSGNTTVNAGTLALSGTGAIASSPSITLASGAGFDISGRSAALTLASGQKIVANATGANTTSTITVNATPSLTLASNAGIDFAARGNGATAPLTVAGAGGSLNLNSAPIKVTTTTALAAGTYTLIAKSGSASVTGTPGTLTIDGSGLGGGLTGSLSVVSGELILTVAAAAGVPSVTTAAAASIGATSATLGGDVTADGGAAVTDRGVVYKTSAGVTIGDNKTQIGSGTGAFSQSITLAVNTRYWHRAYAINTAGTTLGTELNFWTLANVPAAPTLSAATASGFSVVVNENSNPAATEFAIQVGSQYVQAGGALGAGEIWQTKATWGTRTVTGLSPNTQYTVQVKARNGATTQTAFGTSAAIWTLANAPTAPTLSAATASGFSVVVNENSNPGTTQFAIQVGSQYVQAGGTLGASAVWQTKAIWGTRTVTGLSPNTQYTVQVKARNGANTETAFGASASTWTLANVPGAPTVATPTTESLDVTVNVNGNPAGTEFAIRVNGSQWVQSDGSLGASAAWRTAAQWASPRTVTGLVDDTEYTFEVQARNGTGGTPGTTTAFSSTAANSTLSAAAQNVYSQSGAGTGNWWDDGANPWWYEGWASAERRPDIWPVGTRNFVYIGHNNNLTMNVNGEFFALNSLTLEAGASSARTFNPSDGGGISLTVGLYNESSGAHTFNVPIGVDGPTVAFQANSGHMTFTTDFFVNANIAAFSGANNVTVSGTMSGSGGSVTKAGTGALTLSGANTYSGGLTLNAGTLNINSTAALGGAAGTFTIAGGTINNSTAGAITLANNNPQAWNGDFTFTGSQALNLGTGAVTLSANRQVTVSASTLTVGGVISGNHTLTKAGNGTLTLSGANSTRTAGTTVSAGTLVVGATKALGEGTITVNGGTLRINSGAYNAIHMNSAVSITIGSGATLTADNTANNAHNLNGAVTLNGGTLTSVNGPGGTANDGGHGNFLLHQNVTAGGSSQSTISATRLQVNSGVSFDVGAAPASLLVSSVIQGANGFTKSGTGTMTLSGANVYSGTTTINAGTLALSGSGSIASSPTITIAAGATFSTAGRSSALTLGASQAIVVGGTGSASPSTIATVSGNGSLTMGASGTLTFNTFSSAGGAPLAISGGGTLSLASGNTVNVNVTGSALANGSYTLISSGVAGTAPTTVNLTGLGKADGTASHELVISGGALILHIGRVPSVTTSAADNIAATAARLNGNVTSDNGATITERGFVYKTSSGVTISDNKTTVSGTTGAYNHSLSSLSVNARYWFRAFAINRWGTTLGGELDFWTLANMPGAPTVGNPTTESLDVTVAVNGNPADTQFAIQVDAGDYVQANGSLGGSAVWQTAATWGTVTVTGLDAGTEYSFRVKARNGANVETAFGGATAEYTSAGLTILMGWDVDGVETVTTLDSAHNDAALESSTITIVPSALGATAAANAMNMNNWSTASTLAGAISDNSYFSFTLKGESGWLFDVDSMAWRLNRSSTGPSDFALMSSVDGFTSGDELATFQHTGTSAINLNPAFGSLGLEDLNEVEFRVYGWNSSGSGGTTRIDNGANFASGSPAGIDFAVFGEARLGPVITVTGGPFDFGLVAAGNTSSPESYTVSGLRLQGNIVITAPSGFQVSTSSGSGYGASVSLTPSGGTVGNTTIYVRFTPGSPGSFSGNVAHTSTLAETRNLVVEGVAPSLATVTTLAPYDITQTSAKGGGNVTADGGASVTSRGIYWGTSADPTSANNTVAGGSGTGSFDNLNMSSLTPGQTYHVRAFAINLAGTAYGANQTFQAACFAVGPTIGAASSIQPTSFTANWSSLSGATGYRLDVSENPYFDNRVANADFASGDATGWSLQTQLSVSDEDAYSGTHSVKAVVTATRSITQTVSIPVADGTTAYEISYWYRFVVDTGNGIRIWSTWDNGVGTGDSLQPTTYNAKESDWTQIVLVNTPAAGATSLSFDVRVYNGATAYLDGFSVRRVGGESARFLSGFFDRTVSGSSEAVSGLAVNQTYYFRVRGVNAHCISPNSATETVVTRANVPAAPTVTAQAVKTLDVTVNVNGNPAGTQFAIRETVTATFVQADGSRGGSEVWRTAAEWGTIRVSLPADGTTYHFYVKARNSAEVETSYSAVGSGTTWGLPTLTTPTATAIGQTGATLGATVTAHGGSALTARGTVWGEAAAPTGNVLAEGGTGVSAFSHARSGLPQGTRIYYRGYADNAVARGYSAEGSFFTEPGQASTVTFSQVGTGAMRVSWTAGANSDGAIVVVRAGSGVAATPTDGTLHSANAAFGSGADLGSSQRVVHRAAGTHVDVTNLDPNTTYHVAVFAYKGTVANSGVNQGINYRQTSPATGSQLTLSCATIVTQPDALYERGQGGSVNMTVVANNSAPSYAWRKRGAGWSGGTWVEAVETTGGTFIGNNQSSIDTSSKSWGMWASSGTTAMRRDFGAMSVGDVFYIEMDNAGVAADKSVGLALQNSSGQNMLEFFFGGGDSNYTLNRSGGGHDTGIGYTTAGLEITVEVTSSTAFSMSVKVKGGSTTSLSGTFINSGSISRFRAWNYEAGSDLFFNSMKIGPASATYLYEDTAAGYGTTWDGNRGQGPLANGGRISGANTATLSITDLEGDDAGFYDVVVWNNCGSGVSAANRGELTVAVPNYGIRDDAGANLPTLTYWYTGQGPDITEKGGDFNSRNLGEIDGLFIKGANIKTWKTAGGNVTGTKFEYKVWKTTDSEPGSWTERSVSHTSDDGDDNQTWANFGAEIDIFDVHSLDYGTYNVKIRFTVQGTGTPGINESGPFSATFAYVLPDSPDDPGSATATADGNEMVRLAWTKNGAGNDVMIVRRVGSAPTAPTDGTAYSVGGSVGGGTVIYKGDATALEHVVAAGSDNHYAFYSVNGANYYSDGLARNVSMGSYLNYEVVNPFSYTNSTGPGTTTVGGQGFGANYWTTGGSGTWTVRQNPGTAAEDAPKFVNLDNYPAMAGNLVRLTGLGDTQSGHAQRNLGATYSTGVVYVAFMMSYQWDGSNKWAGLSLMDDDTERAFFGKGFGDNWHTLGIGDGTTTWWANQDLRGTAGNDGRGGTENVYLVVGKYDFENDRLQANAWKQGDNDFPTSEPSWTVTENNVSFGSFNRIRIHAGATVGNVGVAQFDEIRVAREWSHLLPTVCPSWVGSNTLSTTTTWLGDSVGFTFQSYPISVGQSGGLDLDWARDGSFSTYRNLPWLQNANNNTYWSNLVQMTSAGVVTTRFVAAGSGCTALTTLNTGINVQNLNPPTVDSATRDGPNENSQINLAWTRGTSGVARDVLVVRQAVNDGWTTPVNGTAYNQGDSLGANGTIVYRGHLESFNDGGLAPDTTYFYRFYSENWSHYSTAFDSASASTAAGGQNIVVDGNPADWIGTTPTVINSASSSRQEWIWRDKRGEVRTDHADHPNADITEFRVYSDDTWVYFLVKMDNVTDVAHPYVAIGVDTRRDAGSTSMNWLGDDAETFIGDGYFAGGAHHFSEFQINVHHVGETTRLEMYAHDGSEWYAPPTGGNEQVAISSANNAIELRVARADLNLAGEKTARFTVASFLNTGVWNNEGGGTRRLADNTAHAADSISISPWGMTDNRLERSAWDEDISDSDIDFWFDVRFNATGTINNNPPTTPALGSPADNADVTASPALSWSASTDGDGGVTGYLLEISTNEFFNGVNGTENGEIALRVNLDASTTSYTFTTIHEKYYWRVRARDTAGALSSPATRSFNVVGKLDTEGPQPTLLYIGTDVAGFLAGNYNAHIDRYGYIQSVTDAEIRSGATFGFVLRWEDPSGVYAANQTHAGAPGGAGQFTFNIVEGDGRVSPNWDIVEYQGGVFVREWDVDKPFFATNTQAPNNWSTVITNWALSAITIADYDDTIEYYLTVSAEDAYEEGGSWWSYGTWPSFGDGGPFGRMSDGYTADGPNSARNVTVNHLIRIEVRDDDSAPPIPATGAGWSANRSLLIQTNEVAAEFAGTGQDVVYTLTDGQIFNTDFRLHFNVYDYYMGMAYGTTPTFTAEGRTLTNTSLNVTHWLTNQTANFNAGLSETTDTTQDDTVLAWRWENLSRDDVTLLWGDAELSGSQGALNRVTLAANDMDNDRLGDQAGQNIPFGWIQIVDDDTSEPIIDSFTVDGVGQEGSGRIKAGGIAIVGVNGDSVGNPDANERFAFVVLSPFPQATRIWFTDAGWSNHAERAWANTNEFHLAYWDSTGSEAVGTVVTLALTNINNPGDQVAVYQYEGSHPEGPIADPENVNWIYALNMGSEWIAGSHNGLGGTNNQFSALYYGLTNEVTAVDLFPGSGSSRVNWLYTGTRRGTASDLLAAISDRSNWTQYAGNLDFEDFGSDFEVLGPGDLDWEIPVLTDAQVNQGGYAIAAAVQDLDKGLLAAHDQAFAPGPYFALFNTDGELVKSNRFIDAFVGGSTAEETLGRNASAGTYDHITLGQYEARIVVADRDNDRHGDALVATNSLTVIVMDDDSQPPEVGAARLSLQLGGVDLPSSSEATLMAGWNFNDTEYFIDPAHGSGSLDTNNLLSVTNFAGSTTNAYNGDESGQALSIEQGTAPGNNGRSITFQLEMTDRNSLTLSYATRGTTEGFTDHQWAWSTDGANFTTVETIEGRNVTDWSRQTVDFSGVGALNNAAAVYIRCTLSGASSAQGNNRFDNVLFRSHSTADTLTYEITDGQLAAVNDTNPLRFGFNVHDPSGVQRGTLNNGLNMSASVEGFFTDNTTGYRSDLSDGDTTDPAAISTWVYDDEIDYATIGTLYGDGETLRLVTASFSDMDNDRPNDRSSETDVFVASLRVIDDDEDPPESVEIQYAGGSGTRPFWVSTNSATPAALTTAQDPAVRGTRMSGSGTNTEFRLTDKDLANAGTRGLRFAFGARDEHSGLARGTSGTTNTTMNFSIGEVYEGDFGNFQSGLSTEQTAANQVLTNVWSFANGTWTGEEITEMIEAGPQPVLLTIPDSDNDRPNDQATLRAQQFGLIRVLDDDIEPPIMSNLNISISSVHNLLQMGFLEEHGWTNNAGGAAYQDRINHVGTDVWNGVNFGLPINPPPLANKRQWMSGRRVGAFNNNTGYLDLPERADAGTFFVWARLSSGVGPRTLQLQGTTNNGTTWVDFGTREITTAAEFQLLEWTVEHAGPMQLRLGRTGNESQTIYFDDLGLTKRINWTNVATMNMSWDHAADTNGIFQYRLLQGAQPSWVDNELVIDEGLNLNLDNTPNDIALDQGVVTGFVFAVDNDNDRLNDRMRSGGTPFVLKIDRTPPTEVPNLTASSEQVDDPTTQFDLAWSTANVGPDRPVHPNHPTGNPADTSLLSPWETYRIYYGPYDPLAPEAATPGAIYANFVATAQYQTNTAWNSVTADTTILDPTAPGYQPDYTPLATVSSNRIRLYDLDFDQDYVVVIVGVDEAGNEGPALETSWATNNTIRFAVTSGWSMAKSEVINHFTGAPIHATSSSNVAALGWIAAGPTNSQGQYTHVTREYDLIYWDAPTFDERTNNAWNRLGTVQSNWYVDDGGQFKNRGDIRFYRASYKDRWKRTRMAGTNVVSQRPMVSEEVYALHNVILSGGQNFVALHGVPYTNTFEAVFGGTNVFPGGTSPALNSTRVEFYNPGPAALVGDQYWLDSNGRWRHLQSENDVTTNLMASDFFTRGFSINLPTNSSVWEVYGMTNAWTDFVKTQQVPAKVWSPILQVPTNGFSQTIYTGARSGRTATNYYNLAALRLPVAAHPSQLNLPTNFHRGNPDTADQIYTINTSTKDVLSGSTIYCDGTHTWRFVNGNGLVSGGYFKPNDVIVIVSRNGGIGHSWTWSYHPTNFYSLPTRWMEPAEE